MLNINRIKPEHLARPFFWVDTESTGTDTVPSLTGVLLDGKLHTRVHDQGLKAAAEEKHLEFMPFSEFVSRLIRRARKDNAILGAYSTREFDLFREASPDDGRWLEDNYLNAIASPWFKQRLPEVHDALLKKAQSVSDFQRVGLKDFLRHPTVGYPYPVHLRGFGPAAAIKRVRDQLQAKRNDYGALPRGAKRAWTNLLKYNEHDVHGTRFLFQYMLRADGKR